jgi:DNA adenine methylase
LDIFFVKELNRISQITDHDLLEKEYYKYRNLDRDNGLNKLTDAEKAIRFFVVNQLAFSGMRRFNDAGNFNVPFGHYKRLNTDILNSKEHINLLNNTNICCGDFETVMVNNDIPNAFMFLDPPYTRVFKEYSANNSFSEDDQNRLANCIFSIKNAKVMMVIDSSDFTNNLYKDNIKDKYSLKYGVNIKNRFSTDVEHLIITNY